MALKLDEINNWINQYSGLTVMASGQNMESLPKPYAVYTITNETRYKEYQVFKQIASLSNIQYKSPVMTDIQYDLIFDSSGISGANSSAEKFYNIFLTQGFKTKLALQDIGFTILSPLRQISFDRSTLYERRFLFEVRYFWANIFTDTTIDNGQGVITEVGVIAQV